LGYTTIEAVFGVGSDPRLHNKYTRQAELEIRESLEWQSKMTEEMARKELGCAKKTSCVVMQLQ
jgi:hypothetical protein